jgi:hypothetical protein
MKPFLFLVVLATHFIVDAQPIKGEAWVDVKKKEWAHFRFCGVIIHL